MKRTLKNLGARVLSIALVLAMITQFAPFAWAAEPVTPPKKADASDSTVTGKPRLYIDFLGGEKDQANTLPPVSATAPIGTDWKYTQDAMENTLFWVGVGIDKMDALALKDGSFSLELGFYYNSAFVEPYTGTVGATYKETLQTANINNAGHGHDWSSNYSIIAAETALAPTADPATQEVIKDPTTDDIMVQGSPWKMTYVSLEKTAAVGTTTSNRFGGADDAKTQYILLIPFRYKSYDTAQKLCFRLVRNATTFTMGAGSHGYADYGAWERITTNALNRGLKLMLDFDGDLNIFTGTKQEDEKYDATLSVKKGGSASNDATLRVTGDKAPNPPIVGGDGAVLSGLTEGTGVTIDLTCRTGSNATVTVTQGGDTAIPVPCTEVTKNKEYTFLMPGGDVTVAVVFAPDTSGNIPFEITLTEAGTQDNTKGNAAELVTNPPSADPKKASATAGSTVTVKVGCRTDYNATVVATDIDGNAVTTATTSDGGTTKTETVAGKEVCTTTLPKGGNATFKMPSSDVIVAVTYTLATTYPANLSVGYPTEGTPPSEKDLAQLSYPGLDEANEIATKYSSIVSSTKFDTPGILGDTTTPPPVADNTAPKVSAPAGQTVTVTMTHDPDHQIKSVIVTPKTPPAEPIPDLVITPKAVTGDKLTATFAQPAYEVNVAVVYEDRPTSALTLDLTDVGESAGNRVTASGTGKGGQTVSADTGATPPTIGITVFEKTEVTVVINRAEDFIIGTVTLKDTGGNDYYASATVTTDQTTGARTVKFNMPAPDLTLGVKYVAGQDPTYTATLECETEGVSSSENTALWLPDRTDTKVTSFANIPHVAEATVAPGYYIRAVVAHSSTGSYPVTTNGNGYNNGLGGTVELGMTMPAEDVTVTVTFVKGIPPIEPIFGATLTVLDPDNVASPLADNHARLHVGTAFGDVVKKDESHTLGDIHAGDLVTLDLTATTEYYVMDIVVTPSSLTVPLEWKSETEAVFTMPADNMGVTVTFRSRTVLPPGDNAPDLTVGWEQPEAPGNSTENKVTTVSVALPATEHTITNNPQTIQNLTISGDTVTLTLQVASGFHVAQVMVLADGVLVPVTLSGDGYQVSGSPTTVTASFVMQSGSAMATVTYLTGPAVPDSGGEGTGDRFLGLTMQDPDDVALTVDNWAALSIGTQTVELTDPGTEKITGVRAGDTAQITWHAEPGYVLDAVLVTPVGLAIVPTMTGPESAEFVMPADNAMVLVRFRVATAPPQYTANLIIRGIPPENKTLADMGTAGFTGGVYSITAPAGEGIDVNIIAKAGYYIESFTVTPANLKVGTTLTGIFAAQRGSFAMPAADCTVNVTFGNGWPDEMSYRASLQVVNPDGNTGNTALIHNKSTERLQTDSALITGWADDVMELTFSVAPGYGAEIRLTDPAGREVPYVRTGESAVGFRMPASHVAAEVRYTKAPAPASPALTLALVDAESGDTATLTGGAATITVSGATTAVPGRPITLAATPGTDRYVKAVLAMAGGELLAVDASGTFVMPERDVAVTVYFAAGTAATDAYAAALTVTAPDGSVEGAAGSADIMTLPEAPGISLTAHAESNGAAGLITAPAGVRVRVRAAAVGDYSVADIRMTPVGSSLSQSVKLDWVDENSAEFTMPAQAAAVEVLLSKTTSALYSAQVLVNDDAYTGTGTSTNAAQISHGAISVGQGQRLENLPLGAPIDVNVTHGPGYAAQISVVTDAGGSTPLVAPDLPNPKVPFGMPAANVVVYVKFVRVAEVNYSATLQIRDKSTAGGNIALTDSKTSVSTNGGSISGLKGGEPLTAAATFTATQANTVVSAVLMTRKSGTTQLTKESGSDEAYKATMPKEDVTITVVLADKDGGLYVAAMEKTGDGGKADNSLTSILNVTDKTIINGLGWTAAHAKDMVEVKFKTETEPKYYATVTAVNKATGDVLPVLQQGVTGGGTARFAMPEANVQVTVTYSTKPPEGHPINMVLSGHGKKAENKIVLTVPDTATELASLQGDPNAIEDKDEAVTVSKVTGGTPLSLDALWADSYRVKSVILSVGTGDAKVTQELPLTPGTGNAGAAPFFMPLEETTLTVTYKSGYSATLIMADNSTDKESTATLAATEHTAITVNKDKITETMDQLITDVETVTTPVVGANAALRGVLLTKSNGSTYLTEKIGAYPHTMKDEDVTVTTVFDDTAGTSYIAAVELAGQFTQKGNGATIVNTTAETGKIEVLKGDIWTMGTADDVLTLTVSLAEGYIAKITAKSVTTNTDVPVNPIAVGSDGSVSTFKMPVEPENVLVTVEYIEGTPTPRPYDPAHSTADPTKGTGWILAVNSNDKKGVTVTVPVLAKETTAEGGAVTTEYTNVYVEADPATSTKEFEVAYTFYIESVTDPGTYVRLVAGTDYTITKPERGSYYEADKALIGEKFVFTAKTEEMKALVSGGGTLYITTTSTDVDEPTPESAKTFLEVPGISLWAKPHDPERTGAALGTIGSVNNGGMVTVAVPTLLDTDGKTISVPEETDTVTGITTAFRFQFYLNSKPGEAFDEKNCTELVWGDTTTPTNNAIEITPTNPDQTEGNYTYDTPTDPDGLTGVTFNLAAIDPTSDIGQIINNLGSETGGHRLYIKAVADITENGTTITRESEFVPLVVPRYYTLTGELTSYAPTHEATLSIYAQTAVPTVYDITPILTQTLAEPTGTGLWSQEFAFSSSLLEAGGTYMLVVEKPSHITYQHTAIVLNAAAADGYTYALTTPITLLMGDIDGDGLVKLSDRDWLDMVVSGTFPLSEWCDLDGDGKVNFQDQDIWQYYGALNASAADYGNPQGLAWAPVVTLEEPAPEEPDSMEPAPEEPAPVEPTPIEPAEPAPVEPTPIEPANPVTPVEPVPPDAILPEPPVILLPGDPPPIPTPTDPPPKKQQETHTKP